MRKSRETREPSDRTETRAISKGVAFGTWLNEFSVNRERHSRWVEQITDKQDKATLAGLVDSYDAFEDEVRDLKERSQEHIDDKGILHTSEQTTNLVQEAETISARMNQISLQIVEVFNASNDRKHESYPVN
jgi:hypothetical protein